MTPTTRRTETFPTARLPSLSGGLPVEVVLVAQIGIGAGSALIGRTAALQRGHGAYVDALDEPSARIGIARFSLGTRVRNRNLFGAFYMRAIDRTHRGYVAPAMLRMAASHLLAAAAQPQPAFPREVVGMR
jgi:hypothetical protein